MYKVGNDWWEDSMWNSANLVEYIDPHKFFRIGIHMVQKYERGSSGTRNANMFPAL